MMQGVLIVEKGERTGRESDEKEAGTSSNFQFLQLMGEGDLTIVPGKWLSGANLKVILFVRGRGRGWRGELFLLDYQKSYLQIQPNVLTG